MSIKQQQEINALRERMDELERKMNVINTEPRNVAGVPDHDAKPHNAKKVKKATPENLRA